MKVLFLNTPFTFSFIPRFTPVNNSLSIQLRKEISNDIVNFSSNFTIENSRYYVTLVNVDFTPNEKDKFELTIKDDDNIIYKGKLIVLAESTDVQNYEYGTQSSKFFK